MLKQLRKAIALIVIINILLFIVLNSELNAASNIPLNANIKTYTIETDKSLIDSGYDYSKNSNTLTYVTPNQSYDFIDESGIYNSVYINKNDVFWSKFDSDMNISKTMTWPLYYNVNTEENVKDVNKSLTYNFANAIYYNRFLYVMYSRIANGNTAEERYAQKVMALVKYDSNGNQIKAKEYSGVELNTSSYYDNEGTSVPFYSANCSLAINDRVLACFFGRNMYMGHQSSMIAFFDLESLEYVSNQRNDSLSIEIQARYYYVTTHYISHSLGQRIISTSDGQFLMMEQGDAGTEGSTRGLMLTKIYEEHDDEYNLDILKEKTLKMTHFSEGGKGSNGYNWIYNVLGGLVEVDDGYMYVGAMEKTLSRAYGNSINEERNLFVQKYSKDFYNKTSEQAQMLSTKIRSATGEPAESNGYGRLYLKGNEKDYGMKWLTNLDKKAITVVRTIKIEDNKIVVLWEQTKLKEYYYQGAQAGYTGDNISDNRDVYYMILDKNANIIQDATKIPNVHLSIEEQYAYKNGKIYWTNTRQDYKTMVINVLDINNPIRGLKGDINGDGKVNITDVALINAHVKKTKQLTEEELHRADVNDDGKVNITDVALVNAHVKKVKILE